ARRRTARATGRRGRAAAEKGESGCSRKGRYYRRAPPGPPHRARVSGPVGWRAMPPTAAELLLAVLGALPRDADLAVVRRRPAGGPGQWVVAIDPDARRAAS